MPGDAKRAGDLERLGQKVEGCRLCPRLVSWREEVAAQRRASFQGQEYWGRPLPGFGDPAARLMIVGLAPAAHGGNRTGRVFTGDRSGDWLWASLFRAGLASQPTSVARGDGLRAIGIWVSAVVRCAPPQNRPLPGERDNCLPYLAAEVRLLPEVRAFLALGGFAYDALARLLGARKRPAFGHGVEAVLPDGRTVVGCYHPSQQNTFTGKLTEPMFDAVFARAAQLIAEAHAP